VAPSGAIAVLVTPVVGGCSPRVDSRRIATFAFVSFALSYWDARGLHRRRGLLGFSVPLLVQGLGMATFFVSVVSLTLWGVPPERVPAASGMTNFLRITAGSFATSISITFWDRREALHQTRLADSSAPRCSSR